MKYNFDAPIDRTHNYAAKYDECEKRFGRADVIPLWIADMDLPTAQPVADAIAKRNNQPMYGYTTRPDSYFEAVCQWQKNRHGWEVYPELCSFNAGVIPAMNALVLQLTRPGDKILFQTPVYPAFFNVVKAWGREAIHNHLKLTERGYEMDFELLEQQLSEKPALFFLCSPHNPVGRVWRRDELERLADLCLQYGVMVVADEIHADLLLWGNKHTPFASLSQEVSENTITCISATKTFNLAGLQASTTIYPNISLKTRMDKFWENMDITRNNCFSVVAVEAAYRHGQEWLDQAIAHFEKNMKFVKTYLEDNIPQITTYLPESTYLMWLDFHGLGLSADEIAKFLVEKAGIALNDGRSFKGEPGYFRLNVACPIGLLEQALEQLKKAVEQLGESR